jgi:hypothetical protein
MIKYDRLVLDTTLNIACVDQWLKLLPYFHNLYLINLKLHFILHYLIIRRNKTMPRLELLSTDQILDEKKNISN